MFGNKARAGGKAGLLAALMGFFGAARGAGRRRPSGNRAAPPHIQQEIQAKAHAKRERKLARPQGWYNG